MRRPIGPIVLGVLSAALGLAIVYSASVYLTAPDLDPVSTEVLAIDPTTGQVLWVMDESVSSRPVVGDHVVILVLDRQVRAIGKEGEVLWDHDVPVLPYVDVGNGVVLIQLRLDNLFTTIALDEMSGQELWRTDGSAEDPGSEFTLVRTDDGLRSVDTRSGDVLAEFTERRSDFEVGPGIFAYLQDGSLLAYTPERGLGIVAEDVGSPTALRHVSQDIVVIDTRIGDPEGPNPRLLQVYAADGTGLRWTRFIKKLRWVDPVDGLIRVRDDTGQVALDPVTAKPVDVPDVSLDERRPGVLVAGAEIRCWWSLQTLLGRSTTYRMKAPARSSQRPVGFCGHFLRRRR